MDLLKIYYFWFHRRKEVMQVCNNTRFVNDDRIFISLNKPCIIRLVLGVLLCFFLFGYT